ncbi:MAG TPA: hypothetical protein VJP87_05815 [Candidatus Acidoferrales bacterium]|nr:hypothetical protein [Candidatus Acidoferrales bacterium]
MNRKLVCSFTLGLLFSLPISAQETAQPPAAAPPSPQPAAQQKKVLKNADIVLMVQNHFDDEMLVKLIQLSDTDFDLSGQSIIDLHNSGVSTAVIRAMLDAVQRNRVAARKAAAASGPSDPANSAASAANAAASTEPQPSDAGAKPAVTEQANASASTVRPPVSNSVASAANAAPAANANANPAATPVVSSVAAPASATPPPQPAMVMAPRGSTPNGAMSSQQLAAMQAQMSAMNPQMMSMLGGLGGMFSMNSYSAEQMPHVFLLGRANSPKMEISPSMAQMAQSKFKGGPSAGGTMLHSLAMQGLQFAALGAGPGGMMAMSALSMGSGLMGGMHRGMPTVTYIWGLPGRKSARELTIPSPLFELSYGEIPGVDPDAYEPALVQLVQTKDNYRLVGATKTKMNMGSMMGGGGPEQGKWFSEERIPTELSKEERGFYVLRVLQPLEPGEYAVVLRPIKGYKPTTSGFGGGAQVFYSVWDFSVPGTPAPETGKKKKK